MRSIEHSPSWGAIRLTVLFATLTALLLVPAGQAFANGTLKVNLVGTGQGEVNSTEGFFAKTGSFIGTPPIACFGPPASGTCENAMEEQEELGIEAVDLLANPFPGSEFTGYTVNEGEPLFFCEGPGVENGTECLVGVEIGGGNAEVTVTFECEEGETCGEPPTFPLTVTTEGTGEGTVTSTPAGIDCGSECEAEFEEGEEVELSQSAETGSEFTEWSGACSGSGACSVTMDEAKEVTATFDLESETLTAEVEGPGSVSAPEDIDCPGVCAGAYSFGETVTLIAEPDPGAELLEWSGECDSVTGDECEVEMTADKTVKATFAPEPTPEFKLTIAKAGTGSGSVTCDGGACAAEYPEGEEVTLAATAASGSTFSGWSGGGCSGTSPCTVTIEADTTVTATFTANAKEEAKKEEVKPPPPTEGTAKAAATAKVKSGKASLKLTCTGGPCKGTIQLKAKVKQGTKTKNLVIGKASFSIAEGATATVKVKLSGPAKQELAKGKTLKAKTSGAGVSASTVKLKPAKK